MCHVTPRSAGEGVGGLFSFKTTASSACANGDSLTDTYARTWVAPDTLRQALQRM